MRPVFGNVDQYLHLAHSASLLSGQSCQNNSFLHYNCYSGMLSGILMGTTDNHASMKSLIILDSDVKRLIGKVVALLCECENRLWNRWIILQQ